MSLDDLIAKFGSHKRWLELAAERFKKANRASWADTFELDPQKDDDEARQFLAKHGLRLKTARSVLDNIRDYWNARPKRTVINIRRTVRRTGGATIIDDSSLGRWLRKMVRNRVRVQHESAESIIAKCKTVLDGRTIYNIPKFLLQDIADHAHRRRLEAKRKAWNTRKRREAAAKKAVEQNLPKSSV